MKFLEKSKDGGPESTVFAYWLFEIKWLGSIVLLKFEDGSRDAYHSHAFDACSWVLGPGTLREFLKEDNNEGVNDYFIKHRRSVLPVVTLRKTTHKVISNGTTWVVSLRGPWAKTWKEILPDGTTHTLTHGRRQCIS